MVLAAALIGGLAVVGVALALIYRWLKAGSYHE